MDCKPMNVFDLWYDLYKAVYAVFNLLKSGVYGTHVAVV